MTLTMCPNQNLKLNYFFQRVLLLSYQTETIFGKPWIPGSYVRAKVLYHFQKKKVRVYKMRPKKKTRKIQGHRQLQTRIYIESIGMASTEA